MSKYEWPIKGDIHVTQAFGDNPGGMNPKCGCTGINLAVPQGTPVHAPGDGTVLWADWNGDNAPLWLNSGISVVLECEDGTTFTLNHLNNTHLRKGDVVKRGDIIGHSGATGNCTGPLLGIEVLLPGYDITDWTLGRSNPCDTLPPLPWPDGSTGPRWAPIM